MPHSVEENGGNGNPAWRTPGLLAEEIFARYALNFDAFADHANALAPDYSTIEGTFHREEHANCPRTLGRGCEVCIVKVDDRDGFAYPWRGWRPFIQPPYSRGIMPLVADKCIAEATGRASALFPDGSPIIQRPAVPVGLFMWDTSTKYVREKIKPGAESVTELPRVQYELAPEDLIAWRQRGGDAEIAKRTLITADSIAEVRTRWAKRTPDSPNFGSAVVVFAGPPYTVKGAPGE